LPSSLVQGGVQYGPEVLATHLKEGIIRNHRNHRIPAKPLMDLPTQKALPMLGTLSPNIIRRDAEKAADEKELIEAAEKLMQEMEEKGFGDRMADMQQRLAPKMDSSLKGKMIEVLLEYFEPDNTRFFVWTKGKMVGLPLNLGKRKRDATAKNKNDMAIIKWDGKYCVEGSPDTIQQQLLKTKWNKHVKGA